MNHTTTYGSRGPRTRTGEFDWINCPDQATRPANIVDPSPVIRKEYVCYLVTTTSGRVLTG